MEWERRGGEEVVEGGGIRQAENDAFASNFMARLWCAVVSCRNMLPSFARCTVGNPIHYQRERVA